MYISFYSPFLFYTHSNKPIFQLLCWEVLILFDFLLLTKLLEEHIILCQCHLQSKHKCFIHLSFNSTLELINGVSSDLHILRKFFNGTAIVVLFRIPLAAIVGLANVFPTSSALNFKDLKSRVFAISAFKFVGSSCFKNNLNYIILDYTLAWLNLNFEPDFLFFHEYLWYI